MLKRRLAATVVIGALVMPLGQAALAENLLKVPDGFYTTNGRYRSRTRGWRRKFGGVRPLGEPPPSVLS